MRNESINVFFLPIRSESAPVGISTIIDTRRPIELTIAASVNEICSRRKRSQGAYHRNVCCIRVRR